MATPLDRWLYFLRHAENLDTAALPGTLDVPEIHRALGDLQMMTQSELERERYESRLKLQRDIYTALKEARDEGEEKGRQEERRDGRIERIHFLQRLLRQGLTPVDQLQKQAPADLERLVEQLEAQALARMGNGS